MSRALWHVTPHQSELRTVSPPDDRQLVPVRALYSLVSTGSERVVASGLAGEHADRTMSVPYMEGSLSLPVKYGYSLIGTGTGGELVHCMHPHQSTAYINREDAFLLPRSAPARRMVLISNVETVLTAMWDATIRRTQEAVICGFGNIGSLLANSLRLKFEIAPLVVDESPWRRAQARKLGFEALKPSAVHDSFPTIFDASGSESGLQFCIDHAGLDGTVVELSWYGVNEVTLALGGNFHRNRVRLISSQVSSIPLRLRHRYDHARRKQMVVDMLSDDSYDGLITNEISFDDSPEFFNELREDKQGDGLIWIIKY